MDAQPAPQSEILSALIVTGGDTVPVEVYAAVTPDPDLVIAADSGLDHAVEAGLSPDVLIGDLDSVTPQGLAAFRNAGGSVVAHPADKDDTDLALAIGLAMERGASSITVLGGAGRRLSHVLGNCAAIAHAVRHGVATTWHSDSTAVYVAAPEAPVTVDGTPGDLVSLLPFGGHAEGVTTTGLRWRLDGDRLAADATRGVSNELVGDVAEIRLAQGLLFVVHERNVAS